MPEKDYKKLVDFLTEQKVSPDMALGILKRAIETKTTGHRFAWKMMRFTLYIWQRVKDSDEMFMRPKIDTVREIVSSKEYKRLYDTYPHGPFNHQNEVKKLAQLIAEPRQQIYFKEGNFKYKGTNKIIPQKVLDKVK